MSTETINVSWHSIQDGQAWSIHVFPHRTFTVSGLPIVKGHLPFIAVLCSMNVLLGQDQEMHVSVTSEHPVPESFVPICELINEVSDGRLSMKLENTAPLQWSSDDYTTVILDSGGKDSRYLVEELSIEGIDNEILFVKGAAIAGEYRTELQNVLSRHSKKRVRIAEFDCWDYSSIGLRFQNRSRWKSLSLILLASTIGRMVCVGINHDSRLIDGTGLPDGDRLRYFSDSPVTLALLSKALSIDIMISPPESYCYFHAIEKGWKTRSCFSPDVVCIPANDFTNSCDKCRTLHIYDKISDGHGLMPNEMQFLESSNWMGDHPDEVERNYQAKGLRMNPTIIRGR
jgi:hypothetical protein